MAFRASTHGTVDAAELRTSLEAFLNCTASSARLMQMVETERSLAHFCFQFKEVYRGLSRKPEAWQRSLVDFIGEVRICSPSYVQLGELLPLLSPKFQLELLQLSLDPAVFVDSNHLAGIFCRCCLYGLKYLSRSCLLRNRARVTAACRVLGPSWDRSVGLCFAAEMPVCLLSDEDFVRSGLAYVNDEGHSLQWLSCTLPQIGRRRDVAMDFVRRQLCLQYTEYADDEEVALEALKQSVTALDSFSLRLRRQRSVLEGAARHGPPFFFTATGKAMRDDRELVLLAAASGTSDLVSLLPTVVADSLQRDPAVLAAVVHGLATDNRHEESVRQLLTLPETKQEVFYQELLKRGGHLRLLDAPLRARRDLVVLAIRSDATSLTFADSVVWSSDDGLYEFVFDLLLAGCPRSSVPIEVWGKVYEKSDPIGFSAALLLENRDLWADTPRDIQEALADCYEHRCSVCFQLPNEIRTCAPVNGMNCNNYFCRLCLQSMAERSSGRVTCPTCRLPQVLNLACGARAWAAETMVKRELEQRATKRRRLLD